jgi:hypothetical protein
MGNLHDKWRKKDPSPKNIELMLSMLLKSLGKAMDALEGTQA